MTAHDPSKRRFIKAATYIAPVIITLSVAPTPASAGSGRWDRKPEYLGEDPATGGEIPAGGGDPIAGGSSSGSGSPDGLRRRRRRWWWPFA